MRKPENQKNIFVSTRLITTSNARRFDFCTVRGFNQTGPRGLGHAIREIAVDDEFGFVKFKFQPVPKTMGFPEN